MRLADLQQTLAASLAGRGAAPAGLGLCAGAIDRARRALAAKRCRALGHLLPRTAAALADRRETCWLDHCARFTPSAMLYHVDDAWELAAHLAAAPASAIRRAAHDDLAMLRLRYVRRRRPGSLRIRERRAPLVAWISIPRRALMVRLPGPGGRVWRIGARAATG